MTERTRLLLRAIERFPGKLGLLARISGVHLWTLKQIKSERHAATLSVTRKVDSALGKWRAGLLEAYRFSSKALSAVASEHEQLKLAERRHRQTRKGLAAIQRNARLRKLNRSRTRTARQERGGQLALFPTQLAGPRKRSGKKKRVSR